MRAHDLLQISGLADLVYVGWDLPEKRCPLWVERSLERAPFVVVRRANLFDGMIPVGVRGSSRQQRSAAYLAPESIRNRITPDGALAFKDGLSLVKLRAELMEKAHTLSVGTTRRQSLTSEACVFS
jgi:phosphoribosyl-dephospho-CoA transferase